MFRILFKKQLQELFSGLFKSNKKGEKRSAMGIILYVLLFLYLFGALGALCFLLAKSFGPAFLGTQFGWLYFSLFGLIALLLAVVGSVFSASSFLFRAKDNDFLLSLPIPPETILQVRLITVYVLSFVCSLPVLIACGAEAVRCGLPAGQTFLCLAFGGIFLTLLAVVISCALGFLMARLGARFGKKLRSLGAVLFTLFFLGFYYFGLSKAELLLAKLLQSGEAVSRKVKVFLAPFWWFGRGAEGSIALLAAFCLLTVVLFLLLYLILSRNFISVNTRNPGEKKAVYKEKAVAGRSVGQALFRREWQRLVTMPLYLMNACIGSILMLLAACFLLIRSSYLADMLQMIPQELLNQLLPVLAGGLALGSTTCTLAASAVSLDAGQLWILQSMPVSAWEVLKAKLKLHLVFSAVPTVILAAALFALPLRKADILMGLFMGLCFAFFSAAFDLAANLWFPKLDWSSPVVVIKQSLAVVVGMFGSMAAFGILVLLYFALRKALSAEIIVFSAAGLSLGAGLLLVRWIRIKGSMKFETLG